MEKFLKRTYHRQDFIDYLIGYLPDFTKDVRKADSENLKGIGSVTYLGKSRKLDLQVFELAHNQKRNEARVALAMDGFKVMRQFATYKALMVYRSDESDDWRLSLMTLTPTPNEKGKASIKFSNPRRFSFFLGPNAKTNTPYKFLIDKGKITDFEDLLKRFSVEVVNEEFYKQISLLFTRLIGGKRKVGSKLQTFTATLQLPSYAPKDNHQLYAEFAVRLIGRLVFCWFLKQKRSSDNVPLVSDNLLSTQAVNNNYYHAVLEKLFFEILNKKQDKRASDLPDDAALVPYLNGGLFEQHTFDFYSGQPNYILKIPDDWLKDFLEILELYNFTIDENTSMDIELSIDPEMLGRIFENLLAEINPETGESARKSTGSYYTPRAIVDYMVQTSLREFLLGKFPPSSREYLDKNGFIKLCKLGNKELLKYIQQHFHKRLVHKSNYFSEDGFENLVVFPRIIAKLRGLDAFDRNKSMHRHFQVNLAVWRAFLSEEVSVVDKLYGNIKKLNLKKRHSWVSVCLIFKYKKKLFAAFFSPLLTNELSLSTIYSIDEKRYDKLKKVHQQLDLEEIFELQKKSSRRDADLPHTGTNPVAAQRFSTLRKLLSDSRLLDEELRVKLGSRDMVLQEVEEILAGTMEQETEDDTKRKIVEALDKLKVLDPACGSGAFPMGILQKVVQILQEVDTDNKLYLEKVIQSNPPELRPTVRASLQRQNLNYARKLGIIRKSIFGVDIQPIATEISRLRVFLSLIVDQKIDDKLPNRGIEVLPNLDFKFVTANSLIGLPKEESDAEQQKLLGMEEEKEIKELKNIMEEYFNSHNDERENCKNRFYEVRSKLFRHTINNSSWNEKTEYLSGWDPFGHESASWFDPEWMFGIKDGFDIVIANPPYSLKLANDYKGALRRIYKTIFFKLNLFACFIERGVHLTKEKGVLTYINPNLLFANDSLKKLRKYLIQNTTIHQLINLGDGVFENVTMPTMIFMLSKTIDFNNEITLYPLVEDMNALKENFTVKQTSVLENFNYVFETMNPQTKEIISRIEKKSLKLGEVLDINQGIITGDDETYLGEVKENTTWKPTIRGKDIDRYFTKPPKLFVKYQPDELACPRDEKIFNCRKKLLMRRTSDRPIVSYDNTQLYNLHTLYSCRGKDNNYGLFFLLALLNSKLFKFIYHQKLGTEIGRTFAEIKIVYTRQLPVIVCTPEKQKSIIDIVDKIFVITKLDDYLKNPEKQIQVKKYEKQIDQMIYKLYGLTKEEIKIVEERT